MKEETSYEAAEDDTQKESDPGGVKHLKLKHEVSLQDVETILLIGEMIHFSDCIMPLNFLFDH